MTNPYLNLDEEENPYLKVGGGSFLDRRRDDLTAGVNAFKTTINTARKTNTLIRGR